MVTRAAKFNLYLLAALALCLAGGCQTDKEKKPVAVVRFYMETFRDGTSLNQSVPIIRANPVLITVDTTPFLTEDDVAKARVLDANGGFKINIQFNARGASLLEEYTAANPDKHIAIECLYGKKLKQTRWLAAPLIQHRISDGQLTFTPDVDGRDEADMFVSDINHYIAEKKKHPNE